MGDVAHLQQQLGLALQQRQFAQAGGLADAIIAVAQGARPTTQHATAVKEFVKLRERLDVAASALFLDHLAALHLGKNTGSLTDAVRDFAASRPGSATMTEALLNEAPQLRALVGDAFSVAVSEAAHTPTGGAGKVAGGLGAGVGVLLLIRLLLKGAVIASRSSSSSSAYDNSAYVNQLKFAAEMELQRAELEENARLQRTPTPKLVGLHRLPAKVALRPIWIDRLDEGPLARERVVLAEYEVSSTDPFDVLHLGDPAIFGDEIVDKLMFDAQGNEVSRLMVAQKPSLVARRFGVFNLAPNATDAAIWLHPKKPSERVKFTPAPKLTFLPPESFTLVGFDKIEDREQGWATFALLVHGKSLQSEPDCDRVPYKLIDKDGSRR